MGDSPEHLLQFLTGISLAINNSAPKNRSEMNGLASTISSVTSVIGPALWSSLYASSIEGSRPFPLDVHLTFYIMAGLRLAVACFAWNMNVEQPEGTASDDDDDDVETDLELTETTAC